MYAIHEHLAEAATDWQRVAVAILGVVALLLLVLNIWHSWKVSGPRARLVVISLALLLAISIYGVIESMVLGVPLAPRFYVVGAAYVWVTLAFTIVESRPADRER